MLVKWKKILNKSKWHITDEVVDNILSDLSKENVESALRILLDYGQTDGAHHKLWVIDQAVRRIAGSYYDKLISAHKNGESGPNTYEWDTGIAP